MIGARLEARRIRSHGESPHFAALLESPPPSWDNESFSKRAQTMPATYHIDRERQIVFSTGSGILTDADAIAHQERLRADPLFQPHFRQLLDSRGVEQFELTTECIRRLAERNPFGTGAKRAFVADRAIMYGFARMFEMLTDGRTQDEFRVFTDMVEALAWLGLDDGTPAPANN
jgi:hypothetical protein